MAFNFLEVDEQTKLSFVGFGVNENVVIAAVTYGTSTNGTPRLEIKFKFKNDADDSSSNIYIYLTEKSMPIAMRTILHLHNSVSKEGLLKAKNFNSNEELARFLDDNWRNKPIRLKLKGEEYLGQDRDGNPKVKVKLALPFAPFAEPMNGTAETPSVAKENSKLTFSKGSINDFLPLANMPDSQMSAPRNMPQVNDLPF